MSAATGRRIATAVVAMLALSMSPAAGQPARDMTAIDLLEQPRVGGPSPSPDGSMILVRESRANWDRNKTTSRLLMVRGSGSPTRIRGAGSGIAWAPGGDGFAFIAKRSGDRAAQAYLFPLGGKPRRLTDGPHEVSDLQWSADGARLYFLADVPVDAATRERIRTKDDMFPFEAPRRRKALHTVDLATLAVTQLAGTKDHDVRDYSVGMGMGPIVYRRAPSRLLDEQSQSELWLLDPATRTERRLTDNDYRESAIRLSPDGKRVLFLANAGGGRYGTVNVNLFVLDIASGAIRELADGPGWKIDAALWSADGRTIYFTAQDGVRTGLHAVPTTGGKPRALDTCDCAIASIALSRDGHTLAYVRTSATQPAEVFTLDPSRQTAPAQLTKLHDGIAARYNLPRQEAMRWTAPDGQALEGLVTYPVGYRQGTRYPLVVQNHGGPRSADKFNIFQPTRFHPLLATHGFVTLSVNYRGGTGYGDAFLQGMNGGYFRHADKDVLSGIDELVKRGVADPDRIGTMGWSAGGHMSARLITVDPRFKAAIVGAGAVDWTSMYLNSDTRWQRTEWFLTPPYGSKARRDLYIDNSPLYTIDKATTPTLILSGAEDKRVPPEQSVMLYRALKDQGVPTELYLAPREPHNFKELRHRLFQINASMAWLSKYVGGKPYVPAVPPATGKAPVDDDPEIEEEPEEPEERG